ncbi:MAG TPA: sulfatase-like hydrolase/transferase, partial [Actinomycetota bacterium]
VGVLILMAGGVALAGKARWVARVARIANPVACVLLALNIVPISMSVRPDGPSAAAAGFLDPVVLPTTPPASRPDVYYLIFDRYANERVLREQYGFDNDPFLDELRSRGFTVLDDMVSNYPRTIPSLASSLNMGYLDRLASVEGPESHEWGAIMALLDRPRVPATFQRLGYRTINVASWWDVTAHDPGADENVNFFQDEFEYVFWQTTMLPALEHYAPIVEPSGFFSDVWEATPKQFEAVARVAEDPGPTFTFGHFLLPHPPYVFRADGRPSFRLPRLSTDEAYVEQVRYTNARIIELLDRLMTNTSPGEEPIIVVQADEGPFPRALATDGDGYDFSEATQPDLERKQGILSALYLPGHEDAIPGSMTPVNTFRLILSTYFGAELPLLPDRAFVYRDQEHPFDLSDVTERLRAGMVP